MALIDRPRSKATWIFRAKMLGAVVVGLLFGLLWYLFLAGTVAWAAMQLLHLLT